MKETMKVELVFDEEVLGTSPGDKEIFTNFVASNAPNAKSMEEEIESIGEDGVIEKAKTVFPKEDGKPFAWDYQIKGFFKDACSMLRRVEKTHSSGLKAYQKVIDGLVFVHPRKIFFSIVEGGKIGECQRPLRASGPKGDRVALANSETIPPGSKISFEVELLDGKLRKCVEEWLDYGKLRGFSQWRNSGKGIFHWS